MNSKELYELIRQNSRIILPEFGAFLVKDSKEKGFNPSNVSFSPFLRYNDGMLEVFVAKTRGISKEDAAKEVRSFVEVVKNELLEKGSYNIENLGWLKRDQRGSLSFSLYQSDETKTLEEKIPSIESSSNTQISTETETQTQIKSEPDKEDAWLEKELPYEEKKTTTNKTRKISDSKAKVEKLTTTKKTTRSTKKVEKTIKEPIAEIVPEPTVEKKIEKTKEPEIETKQNEATVQPIESHESKVETHINIQKIEEKKPDLKPIIETKGDPEVIHVDKKERKKVGISRFVYTILAIAVIVVVLLAIRSYYFPPNVESLNDSISSTQKSEEPIKESAVKKEEPNDEIEKAYKEVNNENGKEAIKQKENEQEEAIKNTIIQNAQVKNEVKKETHTVTNQNGVKFYIIAGSFKNREYAEKYIEELKKSGEKGIIVVQPSGMNAVALGSYNSHNEANDAMKKMKSKFSNLWILKK